MAAPAPTRKQAQCGAGRYEARARGGRCPRAGELFGCAAEDLVGHPLLALFRAEDRPAHLASLDRLAGADWDAEWIGGAVRASGAPFRMALTAAVVRHADGGVYRVRWGIRDISRRPRPD